VLEAAAVGLPVASTDVGDVRTMLAPENAPFVVPRDDAALADALVALLADRERARAVGAANAARAAAEFDQASMFAAWERLFRKEGLLF
jgi:glycosyltransferase involved in cell wall biosynthesis